MINQEKSGKYIAEKRKALGMTQKELAEKVGLTDKAVSKWERGKSIPDSAVLDEICKSLNISFNEYLSGEDIATEHYSDKAEENMRQLIEDKKMEKSKRTVIIGAAVIGLLLSAIGIYGVVLMPGIKLISFMDLPSFLLLIGTVVLLVLLSGHLDSTVKAIGLLLRSIPQKKSGSGLTSLVDTQTENAYGALKRVMICNLLAGLFWSLGQAISILNGAEDTDLVIKMLSIALLPLWYGILLDLILFPVVSRLRR